MYTSSILYSHPFSSKIMSENATINQEFYWIVRTSEYQSSSKQSCSMPNLRWSPWCQYRIRSCRMLKSHPLQMLWLCMLRVSMTMGRDGGVCWAIHGNRLGSPSTSRRCALSCRAKEETLYTSFCSRHSVVHYGKASTLKSRLLLEGGLFASPE